VPINTHTSTGGGGGGGGGGGDGSQKLIDIDFTTLTSQDLTTSGDTDYTLSDGQQITVYGTSSADKFEVGSSGLTAKWTGASGVADGGSVQLDISGYSDWKEYDQWRAWVSLDVGTMVGHSNGPASFSLWRANSSATSNVYQYMRKYVSNGTYGSNMAMNSLTYNGGQWSGGPAGNYGDLGTTTVPSQARLEIHGVDADLWLRGDTGSADYTEMGELTQRSRVRLQGTRFEATSDALVGTGGHLWLSWHTYEDIEITIKRLVLERFGATS
jgi:hypothetical protein